MLRVQARGRVHREGQAVVVEPAHERPEGYVESFAGVPDDFTRPSQGEVLEPAKAPACPSLNLLS
jgi:hypothetical protein